MKTLLDISLSSRKKTQRLTSFSDISSMHQVEENHVTITLMSKITDYGEQHFHLHMCTKVTIFGLLFPEYKVNSYSNIWILVQYLDCYLNTQMFFVFFLTLGHGEVQVIRYAMLTPKFKLPDKTSWMALVAWVPTSQQISTRDRRHPCPL